MKPPVALREQCTPSAICVADKQCVACAETNHLSTVRITFAGTRELVATKTADLLKYVSELKSEQTASVKMCYDWLNACTNEDARAYISAGNRLFYCTIGPADAIYLPAGWCFMELIKGSDYGCARAQVLTKNDQPVLEQLNPILKKAGKANDVINLAIDAMVLAD